MPTNESIVKLTPLQLGALLILMAEARVVTNAELEAMARFSLTGKDRVDLENRGLIESSKVGRGLAFQLTDEGWSFCKRLHDAEVNVGNSRPARSIFVLLGGLHRALDRMRISHGEFFKQAPESGHEPGLDAATTAVAAAPEPLIRAAYRDLVGSPGDWVGLADLRERLGHLDRATVDQTLRAMALREGVRIIPVANTKALKPRDREAALRIGDEDNHALAIGPS